MLQLFSQFKNREMTDKDFLLKKCIILVFTKQVSGLKNARCSLEKKVVTFNIVKSELQVGILLLLLVFI